MSFNRAILKVTRKKSSFLSFNAFLFALTTTSKAFSTTQPGTRTAIFRDWKACDRPWGKFGPLSGILSRSSLFSTTTSGATASTDTMSSIEKVADLRKRMMELNLDVYVVPTDDPHLSEYVPEAFKRRQFLSGFTGSAGTAVVTEDQALLWTDSRYWNQAGTELDDTCWQLQKAGLPMTPAISKWLGQQAAEKYKAQQKPLRVGLDPFVHPASFAKEVVDAFQEASQEELGLNGDGEENVIIGELDSSHPTNLIDGLWKDRPAIPTSPFRVHPAEYAGQSVSEKVEIIRKEMSTKRATMAVFCTLDDVAYLLNVRAMGDIDTCPVGIAYVTVTADEVNLYCDSAKVESKEVQEHFAAVPVNYRAYDQIVTDIQQHCEAGKDKRVWLDKTRANYAISSVIGEKQLIDKQNAVTPMKACKNEAELQGMRRAHVVDGAAMAHFMAWLEDAIVVQKRKVSEVEIDEVLTGFRAQQPGFVEVSFPTIAGVGSNGAIVHYKAEAGSELLQYLDCEKPILIDSGGQYLYGTTDVTRTWHFGKQPSKEFCEAYTRVLKGNIAVDSQIFPENTPGFVLDVFARQHLWLNQQDYGHGTGHGVGAALNVHEGPMSISPRWGNQEVLKQGMVVSNEPGYYEDNNFGVRIENLLEIQNAVGDSKGEKKYLKFEKLTLIPIQMNLIILELMSGQELDWLDAYHELVRSKVMPLLEPGSAAAAWLEKSCQPIDRSAK